MVAVMMQPVTGANQRVVPAVLPSCVLKPVPKVRRPMLVAEAVALTVRLAVMLALTERLAVTVELAATLGDVVRLEPKDWLGDEEGEMEADAVGVAVGSTQERRMMEPVAPAVPPGVLPRMRASDMLAIGQEALKKEEPPPPLAGT